MSERLVCAVTTDCADRPRCATETIQIAFAIDRRHFAPPRDRAEPPRVKRTVVSAGDAVFVAEPLLIVDTRGFWEDAQPIGARMLTVAPDGTAIYTETASGRRMTGQCAVTE